MRYTLDTEFDERTGSGRSHIQLISVAVIAEDGRELYMENADYDWDDQGVDPWLIANVKPHLRGGDAALTPEQMRARAVEFFAGDDSVEIWGYYAGYDWVMLCSIFGRMIDLPSGMPKLCMDIKQAATDVGLSKSEFPEQTGAEHDALADCRWNWQLLRMIDARANQSPSEMTSKPALTRWKMNGQGLLRIDEQLISEYEKQTHPDHVAQLRQLRARAAGKPIKICVTGLAPLHRHGNISVDTTRVWAQDNLVFVRVIEREYADTGFEGWVPERYLTPADATDKRRS